MAYIERTLSPDEKIRRAEEIYYRKRMQALDKKSARVNVSQKEGFRCMEENDSSDYNLYFNLYNFLYDTKYKLYFF